jgi:hypothetical protein
MRAYVITHGRTGHINVKELVSSKRLAIATCEQILTDKHPEELQSWTAKDKHTGKCIVMAGGEYTTYEMFYVNQGPN